MKPSQLDTYGLSVFSWDVDAEVEAGFTHYHPEIEIMILEHAQVRMRYGDVVYVIEPDQLLVFWGMRDTRCLKQGPGRFPWSSLADCLGLTLESSALFFQRLAVWTSNGLSDTAGTVFGYCPDQVMGGIV